MSDLHDCRLLELWSNGQRRAAGLITLGGILRRISRGIIFDIFRLNIVSVFLVPCPPGTSSPFPQLLSRPPYTHPRNMSKEKEEVRGEMRKLLLQLDELNERVGTQR